MSHLTLSLRELHDRDNCNDWAAKVQDVCEKAWEFIRQFDSENFEHEQPWVDELIALLHNNDAFNLTRLVVPELRTVPSDTTKLLPLHRHILQRLQQVCAIRATNEKIKQSHTFDDKLYRQEKEIFTDAQLYRAAVLLFNNGTLLDKQRTQVEEWLRARPRLYQ